MIFFNFMPKSERTVTGASVRGLLSDGGELSFVGKTPSGQGAQQALSYTLDKKSADSLLISLGCSGQSPSAVASVVEAQFTVGAVSDFDDRMKAIERFLSRYDIGYVEKAWTEFSDGREKIVHYEMRK
jgi:hypothetical protein